VDLITISSLNVACSRHDIVENLPFGVKQQPLTHSRNSVIYFIIADPDTSQLKELYHWLLYGWKPDPPLNEKL
jgi:hypothetical protein